MVLDRLLAPARVPELILLLTPPLSPILILVLALPVGEVVEVDIGAPPVLAQEALAHHVLGGAHIVEERIWGVRAVTFRAPGYFKSVVVAPGLRILDRNLAV